MLKRPRSKSDRLKRYENTTEGGFVKSVWSRFKRIVVWTAKRFKGLNRFLVGLKLVLDGNVNAA
jgi:hypothetical protein